MDAAISANDFPAVFSQGVQRPFKFYDSLNQTQPIPDSVLRALYQKVRKIAQRLSTFNRPTPRVDNVYPISRPTRYVDATAERLQEFQKTGKKEEVNPAVTSPSVPGAKAATAKLFSAIKSATRAILTPMAQAVSRTPRFP